ncbi:hypothetical protein [Psittacicella gerlachiana]|uniref:Uncharacterized protein n=1 Tax=Psittacicella gerlachiana TaxID=2028574 RepID=A0A3A1YK23_9GAMM|nr:hypothetical protein [Psittacicella gerlachiana]RIY37548.1 hypothetical protein CKF59_01550 [Psittacicella gerlachiana]
MHKCIFSLGLSLLCTLSYAQNSKLQLQFIPQVEIYASICATYAPGPCNGDKIPPSPNLTLGKVVPVHSYYL